MEGRLLEKPPEQGWLRLGSATLLLLAVQKKAAGRPVCDRQA